MSSLKDYRDQIDTIDNEMAELFQKRMELVEKVAEYKALNNIATNVSSREEEVINSHIDSLDEKWRDSYKEFMQNMFTVSKNYQDRFNKRNEPLLKYSTDYTTFVDNAFIASQNAKKDLLTNPDTVNATIGSLFGEDGKIWSFETVYHYYDMVPDKRKASYASLIQGNDDYNEAVFNWLNRLDNINLPHRSIATPGGTGALSMTLANTMEKNETLLLPKIGWGSYKLMAYQFGLKTAFYDMFKDDRLSIEDIKKQATEIMDRQHKVVIVINDPCHNPTGTSMGNELWSQLVDFFNELSEKGSVIIINDIAYLDYAYDYEHATEYMGNFNRLNENVAVVIAFSCSKSLTAYGMRLGDAIILNKNEEKVTRMFNGFVRYARSCWSNANNGFMDAFVLVTNDKENYIKEKDVAVNALKKRSEIFMSQARECGLPLYPYNEGFFITLKIDNSIIDKYYQKLNENHIYPVKFNNGIRVAICGLSIKQCDGLAYRMKEILDQVNQ